MQDFKCTMQDRIGNNVDIITGHVRAQLREKFLYLISNLTGMLLT